MIFLYPQCKKLPKNLEVTKFQRIFADDCTALGNSKASFHCTHWHNLCKSINLNESRMKQVEERYIKAEIAKFTPQEMREYETSKMAYRDIKNSVDTAKREGIAEGMEKRSLEIARKLLAKGIDEETVKDTTGLSAEQILQLKAEI